METTPAASLGEYWETGQRQSRAKEFALAGAVFGQENGGVYHEEDIIRECAGLEDEECDDGMVRKNMELRW